MTVDDLTLTYESVREDCTFSEGDAIVGLLSFNLSKETKVKRVEVKAKGHGRNYWTEGQDEYQRSYGTDTDYLKVKEVLVGEDTGGNILPAGPNNFKFKLRIPDGDLPSSFTGSHGSIVYKLEAKIVRKWRLDSEVQKEFKFISNSIRNSRRAQCHQSNSMKEEVGVFTKGEVHISATVNKKIFSPGEIVSASAKFRNSSSKTMRPKIKFVDKTVWNAQGSTNIQQCTLLKKVGDPIGPNSEGTISCMFQIPSDTTYTLNNCDIVTQEYFLKAYLDISFAFDPEVVFPIIIAPPESPEASKDMNPHPGGAAVPPSYHDLPAPSNPTPKQQTTMSQGFDVPLKGGESADSVPPSYTSLFPANKTEPQL